MKDVTKVKLKVTEIDKVNIVSSQAVFEVSIDAFLACHRD